MESRCVLLHPMVAHILRRHARMTQEVSAQLKRLRRAMQTGLKGERVVKRLMANWG